MRTIDADRLLSDRAKGTYYHLPNGDTAIPIIDIEHAPTIDAVPQQKYEEDMENAYAHGYTDAESNFRKMIADGELVEVVRCEECERWKNEHICECLSRYGTFETPKDFYCGYGKEKR